MARGKGPPSAVVVPPSVFACHAGHPETIQFIIIRGSAIRSRELSGGRYYQRDHLGCGVDKGALTVGCRQFP